MELLNENHLRTYYKDTLAGDGVCVITEEEFVEESNHFKNDGYLVALKEFTGMATTVAIDRIGMITEAQKLGQKTYETVLLVDSE